MGRTGLRVTPICLGTTTFGLPADERTSLAILDAADEAGINFIDTADTYPMGGMDVGATERLIGAWLQGKRDRFVVATKGAGPMGTGPNDRGSSRAHLMRAIDESLRRLQTDYIDLYYVHQWDMETPVEETLAALDEMRRAGKIRYAGVSNLSAWQLMKSLWTSDRRGYTRFDCVQARYNVLYRAFEAELVPAAVEYGVGLAVYNPLAGGLLTGRYQPGVEPDGSRFGARSPGVEVYRKRYYHEAALSLVAELTRELRARGKSITHVALRWVIEQPGVTTAIVGASRPEQLRDTVRAMDLELEEADRKACDDIWYKLPRRRPSEEDL